MSDTIFTQIVQRRIPATIVYEDDDILGFSDIVPQAPVHFLFVPKHVVIPSLNEATPDQAILLGRLMIAAAQTARDHGIADNGYRLVVNCGQHAGQTVYHLHIHLLGGGPLANTFGAEQAMVVG